jgi:RNA polymerase sigma-70 factor (ECF subfamily)
MNEMMGELAARWEGSVSREPEVEALRRGQISALDPLLARYQNRLYRYLLRMVRDVPLAEDLFQQTWVRVAQNIGRYNPRLSFQAWLFSIAHNLAIDELRRRRPASLDEPMESGETRAEMLPASAPDALDALLESERAGWLLTAMQDLPASYREVLTLRFEEEMKLEEIAEMMATPLSTVKTRLRRGLDALRQKLGARIS